MGRIHALQLDYTDAYTKLMQSSRKAPQNTAMGFQRAAQKLIIIVQVKAWKSCLSESTWCDVMPDFVSSSNYPISCGVFE